MTLLNLHGLQNKHIQNKRKVMVNGVQDFCPADAFHVLQYVFLLSGALKYVI